MFKTTLVSAKHSLSALVTGLAGFIALLILLPSLSIAEVPSAVANTIISKLSSGRADLTYRVTAMLSCSVLVVMWFASTTKHRLSMAKQILPTHSL